MYVHLLAARTTQITCTFAPPKYTTGVRRYKLVLFPLHAAAAMQACRPKAAARGVLMGRLAAAAIAGAPPVSGRATHKPKNGPRAQLAAPRGATESQSGARESENQGQVAR